jgi:uncharacterized protein (DUF983 family)
VSNKSSGIGLSGALFITFVVLRLTDHTDWAWYWVAAPLWVPLIILLSLGTLFLVACGLVVGINAVARAAFSRRDEK